MNDERRTLDLYGLDGFTPRPQADRPPQVIDKRAIDNASAFPSRERVDDDQLNIRAPASVLGRFRRMAKAERYKHGEFLEVLINAYAERGGV